MFQMKGNSHLGLGLFLICDVGISRNLYIQWHEPKAYDSRCIICRSVYLYVVKLDFSKDAKDQALMKMQYMQSAKIS